MTGELRPTLQKERGSAIWALRDTTAFSVNSQLESRSVVRADAASAGKDSEETVSWVRGYVGMWVRGYGRVWWCSGRFVRAAVEWIVGSATLGCTDKDSSTVTGGGVPGAYGMIRDVR